MASESSLAVIRLSGELDIGRRDEIAVQLRTASPGSAVLIDLSDVPYADSTVIAELLRFRGEVEREGRRIAVLIGNPQIARILEYAGLSAAFHVFDDRGAALTYLAGTRAT
jgi:anti-sigma B factor antagonist